MIVVLMGYMASGKSTIGRVLADKLKYDFIDLDSYIEAKEKQSIEEIFITSGEIYFRKIETLNLVELLESEDRVILSLGGGTPCYGKNLDYILNAANTTSFYLKVPLHSIVSRLQNEPHKRPLIAHLESKDELLEFVGKHLFERMQFYNEANYCIDANSSENEIIEDIILNLF